MDLILKHHLGENNMLVYTIPNELNCSEDGPLSDEEVEDILSDIDEVIDEIYNKFNGNNVRLELLHQYTVRKITKFIDEYNEDARYNEDYNHYLYLDSVCECKYDFKTKKCTVFSDYQYDNRYASDLLRDNANFIAEIEDRLVDEDISEDIVIRIMIDIIYKNSPIAYYQINNKN
jgi:hypothetical protein